jgi:hypothetical protein
MIFVGTLRSRNHLIKMKFDVLEFHQLLLPKVIKFWTFGRKMEADLLISYVFFGKGRIFI